MLGVLFHYIPVIIIRNLLFLIGFILISYYLNGYGLYTEILNANKIQTIKLINEFYATTIENLHPYEDLFLYGFIGLNLIILYEIIIFYNYSSLPYSLNLSHKIKNLSKDNSQISILDKFKTVYADGTITFKNRISLDKSRYEDNIEQIREFLHIPKDSEVLLFQVSKKIINIHIKHIPNYFILDTNKIIDNKIYLGQGFDDDLYLDFESLTHCLTVGESGSGKSTLLNLIILSLLKNINLSEQLYLIDFKGVELYRYKQIEKVNFIDKIEQLTQLLEDLTTLMNERYENLKLTNELRYNGKYIFVVIDEIGTIGTYPDKKVRDNIFNLLTNLLQKARAANIYFFVFSQKIEVSVLPTSITSNIQSKILMKTDNDYNQQQTIGKKEVIESITNIDAGNFNRGRGIFKDGISSDKSLFQCCYFDKDTYKKFI